MTTYNIPDETYDSYAALTGPVDFVAGDIINGGGNVFAERIVPQVVDGVSYRNMILDVSALDSIGLYIVGGASNILSAISVAANGSYANAAIHIKNAGKNFLSKCNVVSGYDGLYINNTNGVVLDNCSVSGTKHLGVRLDGASSSTFNSLQVSNVRNASDPSADIPGARIDGTGTTTVFNDSRFEGNQGDGLVSDGTSITTCNRCKFSGNGNDLNLSSGDGATAHDDAEIHHNFGLLRNNFKDAFGVAINGTGTLYHNTAINNVNDASVRAELHLNTAGLFTIYNNVFCNTKGRHVVSNPIVAAHTIDYNAYIATTELAFKDADEGGTSYPFTDWVANGYDANGMFILYDGAVWKIYYGSDPSNVGGILNYCPISTSTGEIMQKPDNPLIGAGVSIAGINDAGCIDHNGTPMRNGSIDIGAFTWRQDVGASPSLIIGGAI